jgi:hypothetical protein
LGGDVKSVKMEYSTATCRNGIDRAPEITGEQLIPRTRKRDDTVVT